MLGYDFHNSAAHNRAVRYGSHRGSLLGRRNAEPNRTGNLFCFLGRLNHRRYMIPQLLTHPGHAHRGYAIQKTFGFTGDSLDTLVGGWRNHGNQAHIVFLAKRQQLLLFFIRHIRDNQRINADSLAILQKSRCAIRKNGVDIGHESHGHLAGFANSPYHLKNLIRRRACRQSADISLLNNRPFGDGIGKRNPQLN